MNKDLSLLEQLVDELLKNIDHPIGEDDWSGTGATLVRDDVEMLTRLKEFCKEPKVWVVTQDEVIECEVNTHAPKTFFSYADALAFFQKCTWDADHDFTPREWLKDENECEDGYHHFEMWDAFECYVNSHYSVSLQAIILE